MTAGLFLLMCVLAGDGHHNTHACGHYPTLKICEAEGRAGIKDGTLLRYACVRDPE